MKIRRDGVLDANTIRLFALIFLIGLTLRFYDITLRPVHHDEAVRAWIALRVFRGEVWEYSIGYHGPFLFYTTVLAYKIFGVNNFSLRIVEVFLGALMILLLLPLREYLGKKGLLFSSALIAFSPAFVHYSKMAIQTVPQLFFELSLFVSAILYSKKKDPKYAYFATISFAVLFTIKENAYVFIGLFSPYITLRFLASLAAKREGVKSNKELVKYNILRWFTRLYENRRVILVSLVLFILFFAVPYSSFGEKPDNLKKVIIEPFSYWYDRVQYRHTKPWKYYIEVIRDVEYVPVVFAVLGVFSALIKRREFKTIAAYWTVAAYAVYSYIPFKEPWLLAHAILPMTLLSGVLVQDLFDLISMKGRKIAGIILSAILVFSAGQYMYTSYDKNFISYYLESNKLTYVQALPALEDLAEYVEDLSVRNTGGRDMDIVYAFDEQYPLIWYWRDYSSIQWPRTILMGINGWNGTVWSGDGIVSWADDYVVSGNRSVKISSLTGSDASWSQVAGARGGEQYAFSGWIRTDNVVNINATKAAQIFIRAGRNRQLLGETKGLEGTNDWTYFEVPFRLPQDETEVSVTMVLGGWGSARGTVWFDNVSISGIQLVNSDFEEGMHGVSYPSVYIISTRDEYRIDPSFESMYVKKHYEIRPRVMVTAYFRKDLEGLRD